MNDVRTRWIVAVGLAVVLSLGTLAVLPFTQGRLGTTHRLVLADCRPSAPRGTVVGVDLTDGHGAMMGGGAMMVSLVAEPAVVPRGLVTLVATNTGSYDHELLIVRAPVDGVGTRAVGSDGKIDESESLGEASASCGRGTGRGITPGASSWVTLRLGHGSYELLCDEPWHYADGMFTSLLVR